MSLQGTFNTSVHALNAQAQNLSNISTNIANVNTTGYKLQGSHFSTLLNRVSPLKDSFFSVDTTDFREVDKQGIVTATTRPFDVALAGRGLFVTNKAADGNDGFQYTRDGAFFGSAVQLSTDTDGNGQNDQGTLLTTSSGAFVYGWAADENGNIAETNNLNSLTPLMFNNNSIFPSQATSNIALQANLSSDGSGRQSVGLPYVDQAGNSRTLTIGFTSTLTSEWTLDMTSIGADTQAVPVTFNPPGIAFDGVGNLLSPTNGQLSVTVNDGGGAQTMTVDLSQMSQFSDSGAFTVQNIEQDGFLTGRLQDTYFNRDGVLVASYSNGEVRSLYKLAIARFPAENNLEAQNGNVYLQSSTSGALELTSLGTPGGRSELVVGALEQSNVDLADQFSKMIVTQRAYSSAATVLRTADEMTHVARDLKR
jgi:flagellar hook protein FlgE